MFLVERMISLFVYTFAFFIAYDLMKNVIADQWKAVLLSYLAILGVFAFFYQPYVTADLYRLREIIKYWSFLPLNQLIPYAFTRSDPGWVIYSFVLNEFGNENWLQTASCFWCFGNVFYIISHEISRLELHGRSRALMLFFIMAVGAFFLQAISGIRTMLGISITAYCFYRETVEGKNIFSHVVLYIFAALLHSAALILVFSRFVFLIVQYKNPSQKLLMGVFTLILGFFAVYFFRSIILSSFETGQGYLRDQNEYTYIWEELICLLETAETVYVLNHFRKRFRTTEHMEGYRAVWKLCAIWTAISTALAPFSYAIFRRYSIFCTIIALPLVGKIFQDEQLEKMEEDVRDSFSRTIWIVSFIIFVLSVIRGDLCGYKFFVLS